MWQSQINVSLSALWPLIQHLVRLLVWPFYVPSKPTSNISVSPSCCALAALHCSSYWAVSLPAAMALRTSGWSAVITQSPFPERMHSQGRLQRGFALIVSEGSKIFLCLFFGPWDFSGKRVHPFAYFLLCTWTIQLYAFNTALTGEITLFKKWQLEICLTGPKLVPTLNRIPLQVINAVTVMIKSMFSLDKAVHWERWNVFRRDLSICL